LRRNQFAEKADGPAGHHIQERLVAEGKLLLGEQEIHLLFLVLAADHFGEAVKRQGSGDGVLEEHREGGIQKLGAEGGHVVSGAAFHLVDADVVRKWRSALLACASLEGRVPMSEDGICDSSPDGTIPRAQRDHSRRNEAYELGNGRIAWAVADIVWVSVERVLDVSPREFGRVEVLASELKNAPSLVHCPGIVGREAHQGGRDEPFAVKNPAAHKRTAKGGMGSVHVSREFAESRAPTLLDSTLDESARLFWGSVRSPVLTNYPKRNVCRDGETEGNQGELAMDELHLVNLVGDDCVLRKGLDLAAIRENEDAVREHKREAKRHEHLLEGGRGEVDASELCH